MEKIHGCWAPILQDPDGDWSAVLASIDAGLPDLDVRSNGYSLAQGASGFAIYYAYREAAGLGLSSTNEERLLFHLEAALDCLDGADPGLFSGYPGVAWAVDHLQSLGVIDSADDLNGQVDARLHDLLRHGFPFGQTELIRGLAGIGVYALGRGGRGAGETLLDGVVRSLERLAIEEHDGITWQTPPEALPDWQATLAPEGYRNIGLAHGIGGVIALLAKASGRGHPRALRLLEGAVDWLLAREVCMGNGSWFQPWEPVGRLRTDPPLHRVSWCYGTFGLSVALYGAGRWTGRRPWCERALQWARQCAATPVESELTWDSCLCHGALGNAHLFNRFHQATGEPLFASAARAWIDRALVLRRPTPVSGGFLTLLEQDAGPDYDPWLPLPGLLEGATGCALALMAALSAVVPSWDAFLLADLPIGGA